MSSSLNVFCCEFAVINVALNCANQIVFPFLPSFLTPYDWCFSFSYHSCLSVHPEAKKSQLHFFDDFLLISHSRGIHTTDFFSAYELH